MTNEEMERLDKYQKLLYINKTKVDPLTGKMTEVTEGGLILASSKQAEGIPR
ncbi:hypothetical protein ACFTQL_23785 [Peribacillus butanolivorans]|uniref:hypothetical protein n=1 Tax=Peribacillus butanolivorans TaxID=421767 RepID=UPI00362CFAA1